MAEKRGRGRPRKSESVKNSDNSLSDIENNDIDSSNVTNNNSNIDIKSLESDDNVYVEDNEVIDQSEGLTNVNISDGQHEQFQLPNEDVNLEQDVAIENNSQNLSDINDDIPDGDFDPLSPPVKQRDYTTGKIDSGSGDNDVSPEVEAENQKKLEEKIPEPEIKNPTFDNLPPKEDGKKKNTGGGNGGSGNNGGGNNNNGGGDNKEKFDTFDGGSDSADSKSDTKKDTANPKLDDLSPAQKRKAAEKSADAILMAYQKFVPKPFKAMSSFNMRKLEVMEMKNELALDTECFDDGTTIKEYCKDVNEQVEQTFVITEEMKQEIKEPLVEVLLENNLALTPTQRLLMAVGGQVVQMTITAVGFMQQNKLALSEFKRFHQESMEVKKAAIYESEKRFNNNNNNSNNNNNNNDNDDGYDSNNVNTNPKNTPPPPPKSETRNVSDDEDNDIPDSNANEDVPDFKEETNDKAKSNSDEVKSDATILSETKNKETQPTVDEYILTEENGGIKVEIEEVKPDEIDEDF